MNKKTLLLPLIIIIVLLTVFIGLIIKAKPEEQIVNLKAKDLSLLKIEKVGQSVSEGVTSDKYAFKTKDNSVIQIGTERHSPPKPYIQMDKWDGEVSLKVRMPFETGDNPTVVGDKLRYSTIDKSQAASSNLIPIANAQTPAQPKVDINIYPKPADKQNEDGGVEFDTILYEKPASNQIVFPIETTFCSTSILFLVK